MLQFKCLILSTLLSFGAFAENLKLVNIYKDSELRGSLGLDIDQTGNINSLYTIDNGTRAKHKLGDLKAGLPVVEKFKFDVVSIISNDFSRETGGSLTVKYVTHKTGIMTLHHAYAKFELSRTEGSWKVYDVNGSAVSNFKVKVRRDAKGAEAGILGIESFL